MDRVTHYVLTKIDDSAMFEKLMKACAKAYYGISFSMVGRRGQSQYGIDLISQDGKIGIQCKNYKDSKKEQRDFVKKIREDYISAKNQYKLPV